MGLSSSSEPVKACLALLSGKLVTADVFMFLRDGTWTRAPSQLKADGSTDMLCAPEAFGLSVSIAHLDLRQRVDLAFIDKRLAIADVRMESELTKESADSIQMLLNERRMQACTQVAAVCLSRHARSFVWPWPSC